MKKKHGKLIGATTAFLFTRDKEILKPFTDLQGMKNQQ